MSAADDIGTTPLPSGPGTVAAIAVGFLKRAFRGKKPTVYKIGGQRVSGPEFRERVDYRLPGQRPPPAKKAGEVDRSMPVPVRENPPPPPRPPKRPVTVIPVIGGGLWGTIANTAVASGAWTASQAALDRALERIRQSNADAAAQAQQIARERARRAGLRPAGPQSRGARGAAARARAGAAQRYGIISGVPIGRTSAEADDMIVGPYATGTSANPVSDAKPPVVNVYVTNVPAAPAAPAPSAPVTVATPIPTPAPVLSAPAPATAPPKAPVPTILGIPTSVIGKASPLLSLSSLLFPATSKGRKRKRDPLSGPGLTTPLAPGLDFASMPFASGGYFGDSGVPGGSTCDCAPKKRKKGPKKKRSVCYAGRYIERADGTTKTKLRKVKCR